LNHRTYNLEASGCHGTTSLLHDLILTVATAASKVMNYYRFNVSFHSYASDALLISACLLQSLILTAPFHVSSSFGTRSGRLPSNGENYCSPASGQLCEKVSSRHRVLLYSAFIFIHPITLLSIGTLMINGIIERISYSV